MKKILSLLLIFCLIFTLTACDTFAFVAASGDDPYALLRLCAQEAVRLLGGTIRLREDRRYPALFEYLGWCSWDSMQIRVSHEGLLEKAREFQEKKVPVHFAIIDDMWADCPHLKEIPQDASFRDMVVEMHKSTMRTFEGDPERFPKGMASAIADLKAAGVSVALISNNHADRVELFNSDLNLIAYADAGKPFGKILRRAMKELGSDPTNTAMLGDQLLTDSFAGRHIGLPSLIVPPIKDKTNLFFRFKRLCERPFIRKYAKAHGYQPWMAFWKIKQ